MKKVHKSSGTDEKKLQTALKKLNVQPSAQIEEVNMFKEDGNVIHFSAPKGVCMPTVSLNSRPPLSNTPGPLTFPRRSPLGLLLITTNQMTFLPSLIVHASVPSNTFAIYGAGEDKELTELVPGILNQLGPDSLASLRKLAESYQSMQKKEDGKGGGKGKEAGESDDDDDIPDLVEGENFESKVE